MHQSGSPCFSRLILKTEQKQGWACLGCFKNHILSLAIMRGTQSTLGPAAYPLVMMLQSGQKLKLDAQAFIGVQLQDR